MRAPELFKAHSPHPDFRRYERVNHNQPPLSLDQVSMNVYANGDQRNFSMPHEGDVSLLLRYKQKEGSVLSFAELNEGEEWSVLQVQGAKSKRSYRFNSCFEWQRCFAHELRCVSALADAEVRQITMPPFHRITNATEATNYQGIERSYGIVRNSLGMSYSEEEQKYIVDVTQRKVASVLSAQSLQFSEVNS